MENMYFYIGLKAEIRREVATAGLEDHTLIIQRAINMEEAMSAIASKAQGVSQQQAACSLVSTSGLAAGSTHCLHITK
jgi:hypothetical protein